MGANKPRVIESEICETPIQPLENNLFSQAGLKVFIKREDLCHPIISGNKWHKLKFNLAYVREQAISEVLSFGGAWSNHLHALAYVCKQESLKLTAVIRGEELAHKKLNPMLQDISDWGAKLHFVSRQEYRLKEKASCFEPYIEKNIFVIPEGGGNERGMSGCEDFALKTLASYVKEQGAVPSHIVLIAGTGTMAVGFMRALQREEFTDVQLRVYLAVHDKAQIKKKIEDFSFSENDAHQLSLCDDYVGKGFGKTDSELFAFMKTFEEEHGLPLDPVYTGKMLYGFCQDVAQGIFSRGNQVLLVHSGGLQGNRSLLESGRE
jgi:1-aminocyclopropane-1-carboxylate deaminase